MACVCALVLVIWCSHDRSSGSFDCVLTRTNLGDLAAGLSVVLFNVEQFTSGFGFHLCFALVLVIGFGIYLSGRSIDFVSRGTYWVVRPIY